MSSIRNEGKSLNSVQNETIAEAKVQSKTQLSEPNSSYTEEIRRIYAKYDKQKQLISIAAHELKSPIVPILGALELIEEEFKESGKEQIILRKEHFNIMSGTLKDWKD